MAVVPTVPRAAGSTPPTGSVTVTLGSTTSVVAEPAPGAPADGAGAAPAIWAV